MDRSHFRRPERKIQSQNAKTPLGNSYPVPRGVEIVGNNTTPSFTTQAQAENNLNKQVEKPLDPQYELARQVPIDMDLPGNKSVKHGTIVVHKSKLRKLRKVSTVVLALIIVVAVTFGGLLFSQNYLKLHRVFRASTATASALKLNTPVNMLNGQASGRINVLLLGRNGPGSKNPDVTNSIMLASIDIVNNNITLFSIPTNLWVNVPGAGVMKLNSAWENGEFKYLGKNETGSTESGAISSGFNMIDQTLNQVLGVNIDYNVLVNNQALTDAVNTVAGINVNVPTQLEDPTMAWENNKNPTIAAQGNLSMNGHQALLYSESVVTTNNFSRATRQRQILVALDNKITSLETATNPFKVEDLINDLGNNAVTDLSLANAIKLFSYVKNVSPSSILSLDLSSGSTPYVTDGNISGQAIVLPTAGIFNYSAIQQYIGSQLLNPYLIKENAKVLVLNGTDIAGLATTLSSKLKSEGFNVLGAANAPNNNYTKSTIIDVTNDNPYTKKLLSSNLKMGVVDKLPNNSIPTLGADFVIIIGSDEANTI